MRWRAVGRAGMLGAVGTVVGIGLLAVVVLVGTASPASAHATLLGTVPAADEVVDGVPDAVELRYDEPVEVADDGVQVFGPDGERVDRGAVDVRDDGATLVAPIDGSTEGTYTVAWRVTSQDSHTLTGSFVFHDGTRTGAVDVDDGSSMVTDVVGGVGRWLGLAGTMTAIGAVAVALLLARTAPASRPGGNGGADPAGPDGSPVAGATTGPDGTTGADRPSGGTSATETVAPQIAPSVAADSGAVATRTPAPAASASSAPSGSGLERLRLLAVAGGAVGAVGALVALLAILADGAGREVWEALPLLVDAAPETRTGRLGLARIGLCAATAVAALVPAVWRRAPALVLILAAAAATATTVSGHSWTAPDRWVAVLSDLAHLGAASVWVGGLLALLAVLPLLGPGARARLATGFSATALVAVAVVAVSGGVSGWQQVRTLDALTSTAYGRLLLAKVVGFAVLVVLGWVNRSRLVPLVRRTMAPLRSSLRAELAVAAVVLALTSALIQQPPARTEASDGLFETTVELAGGEVLTAIVDPAEAGSNDIHLYFADASGAAIGIDAVEVAASTADVPPRGLQVTPIAPNHVSVTGASLPTPGTWTIEVTAVRAGEPLVFTFEVLIS